MSQSTTADKGKAPSYLASKYYDCALLAGDSDTIIAASHSLNGDSKLTARLAYRNNADASVWIGFEISFPLPEKRSVYENAGHGVAYCCE